jgi:hypothetical protein
MRFHRRRLEIKASNKTRRFINDCTEKETQHLSFFTFSTSLTGNHHIFPVPLQSWEGDVQGSAIYFLFSQTLKSTTLFFSFPLSFLLFYKCHFACGEKYHSHLASRVARGSPQKPSPEEMGGVSCFSCIINGYHCYYLSISRRLVLFFPTLSLGLYPWEEGKVQVFKMK